MLSVASLHYDVIFKKAFSQPHIFSAFAQDMLGIEFNCTQVETEKSFSPPIGAIESRFDLFAEDVNNRCIVDIQHKRLPDHYDRFLHYHCTALIEQVVNAYDYKPVKRVFTIVVLTSGDKYKTDIAITDFEPKTLQGQGLGVTQHKIIYLCPKYVTANTPAPYREWLLAIEDSLDGKVEPNSYTNTVLQEVFGLIKTDNTSPEEYARMKDEYANEQLLQDNLQAAVEKGIKQNNQVTAKKMLIQGIDIQLVADITGLSITELHQLTI